MYGKLLKRINKLSIAVLTRQSCRSRLPHQVAIAKKFEEQKHILVAYRKEDLPQKAMELKYFIPAKRKTQVEAVVQRILDFLQQ